MNLSENRYHGSAVNLPGDPYLTADPVADATITRILGAGIDQNMIGLLNAQIAQWSTNADLVNWRPGPGVPPAMAAALEDFLRAAAPLPDWADPVRIERAETVFFDLSILSCTLLFCASLPECYVVPDLAAVLHAAGQRVAHCDNRVRSPAAMIFPVMMRGGLTDATGGGVAQTLKVRLIHATIRHLIVRGDVATAAREAHVLPTLEAAGGGMYDVLSAHGWDVPRDGLPCNQEELAYTLLTFHYVFLRGLRQLGLALPPADEDAYLHTWNVVGHVLGIENRFMAHTMDEARDLFARMQARGRARPYTPDARPALAAALITTLRNEIRIPILRSFPELLTRRLCGKENARELGLTGRIPLLARIGFVLAMGTVRIIDTLARLVVPNFSISRMLTRVVGYNFTVKLLMDQTRPLKLPSALLNQMGGMTATWHADPKAPAWVNRLERWLTRPPADGTGRRP
jgi:hypothetical protein